MRVLIVLASLLAASLLLPGAAAEAQCLFGYDPDADLNVCYDAGTYQEPAYAYEVGFACRVQVGQQCFGEPVFTPLYQGGWYDVPYASLYWDTYCLTESDDTQDDDEPVIRSGQSGSRCYTSVDTRPATGFLYDNAPL